jgi:hypothetical protein
MRKTILAAGLSMLVVLTLAACKKTDDTANNTAVDVSAAPTAASAVSAAQTSSSDMSAAPSDASGASAAPVDSSAPPPGRGDPTRQ